MSDFRGSRDWGRLLTAMLTPFAQDGSVNIAEARRIASYLVDVQRNDGLVVSGTTGESPTLRAEEKLALLEATLEEVGDRAAVVFGAGTYDTAESVEMAREGERLGAHGIMVVNPYYSRPGQEGLYAHFRAVAEATSLPVMLYNIQPRSAINLETPTLMRLIEDVPNIVAVKEASGNVGQIGEVCAQAPAGFRVYSGDDALTLPVLSLGGHGLVSVAAHVIGHRMKPMIEAFWTDPAASARIARELQPAIKAVFSAPSPVPVKFGLSLAGFDCESVRLPLVELEAAQKATLRIAFERALPALTTA
ncbi:MAG: 4-hydroxy-tetrahydrodipicolinate synthase [Fimbriimonadaceae bacterium]|nr:4-hydroxy-tetrahydrodipicolinate synthase [Fimbriimonadaceae bacterium]QYK54723.1 MAG: 4-hydroxy-tetrahydrodipicolinate synthase [Fimbriimonadaceae bacterium]